MTDEQAGAFNQIRRLAAPHRFRVIANAEGYPVIRGKLGDVEWYHAEGTSLAAYTAGRTDRLGRLLSLPGITRQQVGDTEIRVLFPVALLPQVADVLRARRRRQLSPEHRQKACAALLASRFRGAEPHPTGGAARGIAAPPPDDGIRP